MLRIHGIIRVPNLKIKKLHFKLSYEFVYLSMFMIFCISSELGSSLFGFADLLSKLVKLACCGILPTMWFLKSGFTIKRLLVQSAILMIFAATAYFTGRNIMIVIALFIITACDVDKDKIVWTSILGTFPVALMIILACFVGALPDRTYIHEGMLAHSLGFTYYSGYPYVFLFNLVSFMYVREKTLGWVELVAILAANCLIFHFSSLRLAFYLGFVVLAMYVLMVKVRLFDLKRKWMKLISVSVFPIMFSITIYGALAYKNTERFWRIADDMLTTRIRLSHIAFERYAVKLFGQVIMNNNMVDGRIIYYNYFYIDSGYVYSLLGYGLILTLLLIVIYSYMLWRACEDNDKKLFLWLVTLAVFTVINNVWVSVHINCLLILLIPYLEKSPDSLIKHVPRWLNGEKTKS